MWESPEAAYSVWAQHHLPPTIMAGLVSMVDATATMDGRPWLTAQTVQQSESISELAASGALAAKPVRPQS